MCISLLLLCEGACYISPTNREALEEIFHRIDLDDNGSISRTELDFFQERTCGEMCDDAAWKVIQGEWVGAKVSGWVPR